MTLETMVFADEIVSPDRFAELDGEVKTSDRELAVAKQLIESLSGPFEPEEYHDEYREQVLALIDRKASGEEIILQPSAPDEKVDGADLMSALQASLEEVKQRTGAGPNARARRPGRAGARRQPPRAAEPPARPRRPGACFPFSACPLLPSRFCLGARVVAGAPPTGARMTSKRRAAGHRPVRPALRA